MLPLYVPVKVTKIFAFPLVTGPVPNPVISVLTVGAGDIAVTVFDTVPEVGNVSVDKTLPPITELLTVPIKLPLTLLVEVVKIFAVANEIALLANCGLFHPTKLPTPTLVPTTFDVITFPFEVCK